MCCLLTQICLQRTNNKVEWTGHLVLQRMNVDCWLTVIYMTLCYMTQLVIWYLPDCLQVHRFFYFLDLLSLFFLFWFHVVNCRLLPLLSLIYALLYHVSNRILLVYVVLYVNISQKLNSCRRRDWFGLSTDYWVLKYWRMQMTLKSIKWRQTQKYN